MTTGSRFPSGLGPIYSLAAIKQGVASEGFRFMTSVVDRFRSGVGDWSDAECHAYMRGLVAALDVADFADVASWRRHPKGMQTADVYGKRDDLGLWYIKVATRDDGACLFSCHMADHDMRLKNGTMLKVSR